MQRFIQANSKVRAMCNNTRDAYIDVGIVSELTHSGTFHNGSSGTYLPVEGTIKNGDCYI